MQRPPQLATRFLQWFCRPDLLDEIQGDLEEEFNNDQASAWLKGIKYWIAVLGFCRFRFFKKTHTLYSLIMTHKNLQMAFRQMKKKPLFSAINIFGLSAGLTCTLVIVAYVQFMLSFDKQYANAGNLHRITMRWTDDGVESHSAMTVPPAAEALEGKLHGIKSIVKVFPVSGLVSRAGREKTREPNFCFADSLFFTQFNFASLHGNLNQALDQPFSVVIPETIAIKYFGRTDVVGEELIFDSDRGQHRFNITAVLKPLPQNIHFKPDFIAAFSSMERIMPWYNNWHYPPMYVYVERAPEKQTGDLEAEINRTIIAAQPDYIKKGERSYFLQPVTDIHLHSNLTNEWQANSNYAYVQTLTLIALSILVLAAINYVNLASARGAERAKEVGVRKVMGAFRAQLINQFLSESLLTTFIALPLSILSAELALKLFVNPMIEKNLGLFTLFEFWQMGVGLVIVLFIALAAGFYPALVLSRFKPSAVLKGKGVLRGGLSFRRVLVIFQFGISCLLIVGMLVVQRQVSFIRNKALGFDKEQLVAVKLFGKEIAQGYETLKNNLKGDSHIKQAAVSSTFPFQQNFYGWQVIPEGFTAEDGLNMKGLSGDEDLLKTLNLTLVAGRDFSSANKADSEGGFILNETAVRMLKWTEPINKDFELTFFANGPVVRKGKVIGVVKDFHFESLYSVIEPLVIFVNKHPNYCDYLLVKLAGGDLSESLQAMNTHWKNFSQEKPFEFLLADDDLNTLYLEEMKLSKMFTSFTLLSVLISGLGLFGLSAFAVGQRVKEIGIRKVLGATTPSLFTLLSKEYLTLTLLAQLLAAPVAWWMAQTWLQSFAYKIQVPWYLFLFTFGVAVAICILSIAMHVVKASLENPIGALRNE